MLQHNLSFLLHIFENIHLEDVLLLQSLLLISDNHMTYDVLST